MVALQFLVLPVLVRVRVSQRFRRRGFSPGAVFYDDMDVTGRWLPAQAPEKSKEGAGQMAEKQFGAGGCRKGYAGCMAEIK